MNYNMFIDLSLQTHLFFDRIMKEHALFLEIAFPEKYRELKLTSGKFEEAFERVLTRILAFSNNNFRQLDYVVTKNTLKAETMMNRLLGTNINTDITKEEINNQGVNIVFDKRIVDEINNINNDTLKLIENFINFQNDILNKVLTCEIYTSNYPLLIKHIIEEAKMYHNLLNKINKGQFILKEELYNQELFWNNIMKEHAEFIRGLLDPSEKELILTADKFAEEYQMINKQYPNNLIYLTNASLKETINFKDFKTKGEEGILNCKIKSIITPLMADHVLREANYYLSILRMF